MEIFVIVDAFEKCASLEVWTDHLFASKRYYTLCKKSPYPDQLSLLQLNVNEKNPLFEEIIIDTF